MSLNLYRRHFRGEGKCKAGRKPDSRNGEFEERKKTWKQCDCPIFASGVFPPAIFPDGKFHRKSTEKWTWDEARAVVAAWTGMPISPPPSPHESPVKPETTIEAATARYLKTRGKGGRQLADSTMRKYRTLVNQLLTYAADKGFVYMKQLGVSEMDDFYQTWKDGACAKGKKLERLKGFTRFCKKRGMLEKSIAKDLKPPVGASTPASKWPLMDPELIRIYEACDRLPIVKWSNGRASGEWTGEDIKTFIMLLAWTGMRISDGALFSMSKVTKHPVRGANILIRMKKTDKVKPEPLYTWIDDWLYERLLARERKYGSQIFITGTSSRLETVTDLWRRQVNKVFDLAGPYECGTPTPHIFRHTFVRLLLQKDVDVKVVAELIGDTEEMVRRHYKHWVPGMQDNLTNTLMEKLSTAPKPQLAVIAGGKRKRKA